MDNIFGMSTTTAIWIITQPLPRILLGHTHEVIDRAVAEAVSQLDCTSLGTTEDEIAVSKKIVEHVPSAELALLCNSGSEATYHALRVSRAYTTRA